MGTLIPTVFFLYLLVLYKLKQIAHSEKSELSYCNQKQFPQFRMHNEPEVTKKKFFKFRGYGGHSFLYMFIVSLIIAAAAVLLGEANTYHKIRHLMQKDCDVVEVL